MEWKNKNNKLTKTYSFKDFMEAVNFINKVAVIAEEIKHHPTLYLHSYKKVDVQLTTHDQGAMVTEIDFKMAERIDEIIKED